MGKGKIMTVCCVAIILTALIIWAVCSGKTKTDTSPVSGTKTEQSAEESRVQSAETESFLADRNFDNLPVSENVKNKFRHH